MITGKTINLLYNVADSLRDKVSDLELIIIEIAEVLEKVNIPHEGPPAHEEEYYTYLYELSQIFEIVKSGNDKKLQIFISTLPWENFKDDDDSYYSLGSMFYNKLTWVVENSIDSNMIEISKKLLRKKCIENLLDNIETNIK